MSDRRVTPVWMTVAEAARGWGVSRMHGYRIIRKRERELGRRLVTHGRIRVSEYLAVPRGEVEAAPMIPDVEILWDKFEALAEQQRRILTTLARIARVVSVRHDM